MNTHTDTKRAPKKEPNLRQRSAGANYTFRVQIDGKDKWISTGTNQIAAAKSERARLLKLASDAKRTGRWELLGLAKLRTDLPTLQVLREKYDERIGRECVAPPSAESRNDYWRNLRQVFRWAQAKNGKPSAAELADLSLVQLAGEQGAELVKSFRANWLAAGVAGPAGEGARRRSGDSMLRQARACFGEDAMRCYTEWQLPELKAFMKSPGFGAAARQHVDIAPATLADMADSADKLATANPRLFIIHLAHKFLGLRNSEIEEARVGWFQAVQWASDKPVQWMLEVSPRCGFKPKASEGSVPFKREVAQALVRAWALLEVKPDGDPLQYLVPARTATERHEAIYYEHAQFVRQFLPREDFGKAGYELRRWAFRTIQSKTGSREAARAFLRHAMPADAARHYQARFYPWHTLGDDVGLSFEEARAGLASLTTARVVPSAWASLA